MALSSEILRYTNIINVVYNSFNINVIPAKGTVVLVEGVDHLAFSSFPG